MLSAMVLLNVPWPKEVTLCSAKPNEATSTRPRQGSSSITEEGVLARTGASASTTSASVSGALMPLSSAGTAVSSKRRRKTKEMVEGTAPSPSKSLQAVVRRMGNSTRMRPTRELITWPVEKREAIATINFMGVPMTLPRKVGVLGPSTAKAAMKGYSPPMPKPTMKRAIANCLPNISGPLSCTNAQSKEPPSWRDAVVMPTPFLPTQSASQPKQSCPVMTPTMLMLTMRLWSPGSMAWGCFSLMMAMTKSILKRS
mmetsp:Transcript_97286/g.302967  ORF Transcript_97286/g.302967 Transcript_97286/m.302967 type:complete len:256 (+) Transcript_97286:567-1334(+)